MAQPQSPYLRATASSGLQALSGLNADLTQVSLLESNWPFLSWAIFLFGSGCLVASFRKKTNVWYGWLSVVVYCLHQSEEHAYDLRGWRYAFVPSLNLGPIAAMYTEACAGRSPTACPLDPKITLWVNVIFVWVGFSGCTMAAMLFPKRCKLACFLNWGSAVVNGIFGHLLPAILTLTYNPGLGQSILMVPLGICVIRTSHHAWLCVANGIASHAFLIVGINLIFLYKTPEAITMIVLMLAATLVLPLAISNHVLRHYEKRSSSSDTSTIARPKSK